MGSLYRNDLYKYQNYFSEAAKLFGVDIQYKYLIKRKTETVTGESIYSDFSEPIKQSVIIEEGLPKIDSLKQLGWFTDVSDEQLLVDFSIDTPNLQEGCRFSLTSNENPGQNKEYAIIKLSNEQLYPTCIKCLCIPILENNSTVLEDGTIIYGEQDITSDDENYSYISEKPQITIF